MPIATDGGRLVGLPGAGPHDPGRRGVEPVAGGLAEGGPPVGGEGAGPQRSGGVLAPLAGGGDVREALGDPLPGRGVVHLGLEGRGAATAATGGGGARTRMALRDARFLARIRPGHEGLLLVVHAPGRYNGAGALVVERSVARHGTARPACSTHQRSSSCTGTSRSRPSRSIRRSGWTCRSNESRLIPSAAAASSRESAKRGTRATSAMVSPVAPRCRGGSSRLRAPLRSPNLEVGLQAEHLKLLLIELLAVCVPLAERFDLLEELPDRGRPVGALDRVEELL